MTIRQLIEKLQIAEEDLGSDASVFMMIQPVAGFPVQGEVIDIESTQWLDKESRYSISTMGDKPAGDYTDIMLIGEWV